MILAPLASLSRSCDGDDGPSSSRLAVHRLYMLLAGGCPHFLYILDDRRIWGVCRTSRVLLARLQMPLSSA